MRPSTRDIVGLVRELLRETRKSGIATSREIASSDTFFDDIDRRAVAARRTFRAKFTEAKAQIERELGPAQEREDDIENVVAVWNAAGTEVQLILAHEDKEMPFVLTVCAEHGAPLLVEVTGATQCECSTLTTTKDPFIRTDLVLMKNNPAIQKTHIRVAVTKVGSTPVRLYQCRGCGQFRQSGDAGVQYVFEVPPIDLDEWKREPYVDQLESKMYEATLETYLKNCADRTTAAEKCSTRGCSAKRVRYSGVCFKHYEERRPVPPPGRTLT